MATIPGIILNGSGNYQGVTTLQSTTDFNSLIFGSNSFDNFNASNILSFSHSLSPPPIDAEVRNVAAVGEIPIYVWVTNQNRALWYSYASTVYVPEELTKMFYQCTSLEDVDLTGFNFSQVKSIESFFHSCYKLKSMTFTGLNLSQVTAIKYLFMACANFGAVTLNLLDLNLPNTISIDSSVASCNNLETLNLSNLKLPRLSKMTYCFSRCPKLKTINFSNICVGNNVRDTTYMFYGCSSLITLDVSWLDIEMLTTTTGMFSECSSLKTVKCQTKDVSTLQNILTAQGLSARAISI